MQELVVETFTRSMFCCCPSHIYGLHYILAAFSDAGTPQFIVWGSYPTVRKDDLLDYTFCVYCSRPKSPRTHHCSSCGKCVLDMDHHCPFIGNCVGAANHRYFICFLIAAVISVAYAATMSAYSALHMLPSVTEGTATQMHKVRGSIALTGLLMEIFTFWVTSAVLFSARGLVLLYLFVASISVEIGLTVLLWQQLYFIYEGRTYLTSLTSEGEAERDCRNLYRFFGFPYLSARYFPSWCSSRKIHRK
uniref:S-acyltransferase n=1 Tax=Opuntia streptacantha TaxID=393608 RepID=A0A7C9D6X9_OPUST